MTQTGGQGGRPSSLARWAAALSLTCVVAAGCSRPIKHARTNRLEPPAPEELAAKERVTKRKCSPYWGLLFPGLGQLCTGKPAEGAVLLGLGTAQIATSVAVGKNAEDGFSHPGAVLPLLAFQDLWIYGLTDPAIDSALAARKLYAPRDTLADLALAPFNIEVMKKPEVWVGTLAALAIGMGVSFLASDDYDSDLAGRDPRVFGYTVSPGVGYPVAFATGASLFTHVAIAEEVLFRGALQSGIARREGETRGWAQASLLFGAVHGFNALALPAGERKNYLLYGLPWITALGGYLGWVYKKNDYSLAPPVAVHFWYDLLLSMGYFALDPENSVISGKVTIPF